MDAVRHGVCRFGHFLASTVPFAEGVTQFLLNLHLTSGSLYGESHTTSQNFPYFFFIIYQIFAFVNYMPGTPSVIFQITVKPKELPDVPIIL